MVESIEHEALVLSGGQDSLVAPEAIDAVQSLRPDWRFVRAEHLGHVPQMEAADWVLSEIDAWLVRSDREARAT